MKNRITFDLAPGQTLADVLEAGSSRAKAYLMALAEAVRAAGLPKLPENGAGLPEWLKLVDAPRIERARTQGRAEEFKAWNEMLANVTGSSDGIRTAFQAKRLLTDYIEQERQDARRKALKDGHAAIFACGREAGLREAVQVVEWSSGMFIFYRPDGCHLKENGKWESTDPAMRFPTREAAEAAKLTCAPWWLNEEAK